MCRWFESSRAHQNDLMDESQLMALALEEAEAAARVGEVPVGAVLACLDGTVLARNHNRREESGDPTAHAEILVIREAARLLRGWRLTGTVLVVTLEPCLMCAGAMILARIDRLVYGADDPKAGAVASLYQVVGDERLNHRLTARSGVMEAASRSVLQSFFRDRRR